MTSTTIKDSVLTPRTGISFAVVVVLIGGLTANIRMVSSISEKEAVVATEVKAMRNDIGSIKTTIREYTQGADARMQNLQSVQFQHQLEMAKKIAEMEGELRSLREERK